jgi:hypothetical protein
VAAEVVLVAEELFLSQPAVEQMVEVHAHQIQIQMLAVAQEQCKDFYPFMHREDQMDPITQTTTIHLEQLDQQDFLELLEIHKQAHLLEARDGLDLEEAAAVVPHM